MPITYDDLRDRIGDKLGYGVSSSSWSADATKSLRVERCLTDGLDKFYNLDILPGEAERHEWSFLVKTAHMITVSGSYRMVMPADFSMLEGHPTFQPGEDSIFAPIEVTGAELLRFRLQQDQTAGRPTICAVQVATVDESVGTYYELLLWPTPDDDYHLDVPYKINPTIPGEDESVPLGGQPHERTLIAACIAAAESFDELSDGRYEAAFVNALRSSVSHDRKSVQPFNLGVNTDNSDVTYRNGYDRSSFMSGLVVTYNGDTV